METAGSPETLVTGVVTQKTIILKLSSFIWLNSRKFSLFFKDFFFKLKLCTCLLFLLLLPIHFYMNSKEQVGSSVNVSGSMSWGSGFEPRTEQQLSWLRFYELFLSLCRLKLRSFPSAPFQIQCSLFVLSFEGMCSGSEPETEENISSEVCSTRRRSQCRQVAASWQACERPKWNDSG